MCGSRVGKEGLLKEEEDIVGGCALGTTIIWGTWKIHTFTALGATATKYKGIRARTQKSQQVCPGVDGTEARAVAQTTQHNEDSRDSEKKNQSTPVYKPSCEERPRVIQQSTRLQRSQYSDS